MRGSSIGRMHNVRSKNHHSGCDYRREERGVKERVVCSFSFQLFTIRGGVRGGKGGMEGALQSKRTVNDERLPGNFAVRISGLATWEKRTLVRASRLGPVWAGSTG